MGGNPPSRSRFVPPMTLVHGSADTAQALTFERTRAFLTQLSQAVRVGSLHGAARPSPLSPRAAGGTASRARHGGADAARGQWGSTLISRLLSRRRALGRRLR